MEALILRSSRGRAAKTVEQVSFKSMTGTSGKKKTFKQCSTKSKLILECKISLLR